MTAGVVAQQQDEGADLAGGLLSGIDPWLAFGSILLAIALLIYMTAKFLTARDGWLERRQTGHLEEAREQRAHEQEIQRAKAENDQRIVDQVLAQTSGQAEQLIAQSNKLQENLFTVVTEQLGQMGQNLSTVMSTTASQAVTAEQTQQTIRTLQLELAQLRVQRDRTSNRNNSGGADVDLDGGADGPAALPAPVFKKRPQS